jgi:hypothetical protein
MTLKTTAPFQIEAAPTTKNAQKGIEQEDTEETES